MTRLGSLMLVLLGSLALVTGSWAQSELGDSKAGPGAVDPIVTPALSSIGGHPRPHSYWRRLQAMVASDANWKLPSSVTTEPPGIDAAEGAGGLRFGMTTDDVVALWGLPTGIELRWLYGDPRLLIMSYGRNRLGFHDNALCRIALADDAIPAASFSNGIGFESSPDDVLATLGTPFDENADGDVLWFHDGETRLRFHFMEGYKSQKPELIVIELIRCGS